VNTAPLAALWTLIAVQVLTATASAVHLTQRWRHDGARFPRAVHRTAPLLLVTCLLPLAALLPADAPAAAWGLWGATVIAAALIHGAADAYRDIPVPAPPGPERTGPAP